VFIIYIYTYKPNLTDTVLFQSSLITSTRITNIVRASPHCQSGAFISNKSLAVDSPYTFYADNLMGIKLQAILLSFALVLLLYSNLN